jgi:hypothetical protein
MDAIGADKMKGVAAQLKGQRFGRLTVCKDTRRLSDSGYRRLWRCRCDCGTTVDVSSYDLVSGKQISCGCARRERFQALVTKHGGSGTSEYGIWRAMNARVRAKPGTRDYRLYVSKGVKVWARWQTDYQNWLDYMGPRPSSVHSIDRWPNRAGNYEPGNVRWATPTEQARNTNRNVYVTIKGERKTLGEWAEISGVNEKTIRTRLEKFGWSTTQAVWEPTKEKFRNSLKELVRYIDDDPILWELCEQSVPYRRARTVLGKDTREAK